jgi:hypothetical protein
MGTGFLPDGQTDGSENGHSLALSAHGKSKWSYTTYLHVVD